MDPEPGSNILLMLLSTSFWELMGGLIWPFILFLVLMAFSFLASSSEVAFLNLDGNELDDLEKEESKAAKRTLSLIKSSEIREQLLATILIVNNFANVFAILVAVYIVSQVGAHWEISEEWIGGLNLVLVTSLLLLFGEILPKIYANQRRIRLAKFLSLPLLRLRNLLSFPVKLLMKSTKGIRQWVKKYSTESASLKDVKHAIDLTVNANDDENDHRILRGIVNFGHTPVKSVMKARVDVVAIDRECNLEEVIEIINEHKYSRMPVYEESLDDIKGILHVKSLLPLLKDYQDGRLHDVNWEDLLSEPYFVPESKKIDDLLEELKTRRLHFAVIADEFGGTLGIVTLEDIIEEIFGEILDESDTDDIYFRQIDEYRFVLESRIAINDISKVVPDLDEDEFTEVRGDSDSLGGLILELNGRIPKPGDVIAYKHFDFVIESATKNRIERVMLIIHKDRIVKED
ncbi:MAG: gliding motility-associated protein GldE [Bacteroidia bacterium]